jgi:vacuolar-type H+-ATPase subunit F/Vma7
MFDGIAVIGDLDLVFPLRVMGIRTYSPRTEEEARQVLASLEKDNIALCLLHERFFEVLKKEREALAGKFCPVIAGFSDYRMVTDHLGQMIRDLAVKATGSDSLVKGRGNDEAR